MIKVINIDSEQFENIKSCRQRAIVVENDDFQLDEKLCLTEDVEDDELQTQDSLTVLITHLLFDENNYCITEDCVLVSFELERINHKPIRSPKDDFVKYMDEQEGFKDVGNVGGVF